MFDEAVIALTREDEVVEEADAEELACFREALGDLEVFWGRFEPARRMVVPDDDRAGPVLEGIGKDLTGMDYRAVDEADRDYPRGDDLVGPVEGAADEAFLLAVRPVGYDRPDIPGRGDAAVAEAEEPPAELKGGGDGAGLGRAHAADASQDGGIRISLRDVEELEHLIGELADFLAPGTSSEEGSQEIGIGQG